MVVMIEGDILPVLQKKWCPNKFQDIEVEDILWMPIGSHHMARKLDLRQGKTVSKLRAVKYGSYERFPWKPGSTGVNSLDCEVVEPGAGRIEVSCSLKARYEVCS